MKPKELIAFANDVMRHWFRAYAQDKTITRLYMEDVAQWPVKYAAKANTVSA